MSATHDIFCIAFSYLDARNFIACVCVCVCVCVWNFEQGTNRVQCSTCHSYCTKISLCVCVCVCEREKFVEEYKMSTMSYAFFNLIIFRLVLCTNVFNLLKLE